jgi:peptidoglycan hydrolase-like protein with peptidoglycan-binding domain
LLQRAVTPIVFVVFAAVAICADPPAQVTKSQTKSASSKRRASKSAKKTAPPVRPRAAQQQPTPERYKEIQQALADKGYFQGPVDGNWGPESVDALTRFQREQNLIEDGKISSLALIALGLGPKRAALPTAPPPEAK